MKQKNELKEKSESKKEKKEVIKEAVMELSDDDLENVSGGVSQQHINHTLAM